MRLTTLTLYSFLVWTPFNFIGFMPISFYFTILICIFKFKRLSLAYSNKYFIVLIIAIATSNFLITPIIGISEGNNYNLNHILAETYIFFILLPVCHYIIDQVYTNKCTEVFYHAYLLLCATIIIEYIFGIIGYNLNQILGFHTNAPAGNGLLYRAKGFFNEPSEAAVGVLFFYTLCRLHSRSNIKNAISICLLILIMMICRSATAIVISIIVFITLYVPDMRSTHENIKRLWSLIAVTITLYIISYTFNIGEVIQIILLKLSLDQSVTSGSARLLTYISLYEMFQESSFVQFIFGRGTGYLSENFGTSSLSWIFSLILEKGIILTLVFHILLFLPFAYDIGPDRNLKFHKFALLLVAYLPLVVTTGYYFPYLAFAIAFTQVKLKYEV